MTNQYFGIQLFWNIEQWNKEYFKLLFPEVATENIYDLATQVH